MLEAITVFGIVCVAMCVLGIVALVIADKCFTVVFKSSKSLPVDGGKRTISDDTEIKAELGDENISIE
jgi:hypothetical protein